MSVLDAFNKRYEKNRQAASGNKVSNEDRMKKYFTTLLPKGVTTAQKRIRILPPKSTDEPPFTEVFFHEMQVDGNWVKLYDPAQEGKRSPLNEVYKSLYATGVESDRELAKTYRSRKYYIMKVIDRDNEKDGPKFWRFKHLVKNDGIIDKIHPIFNLKGDASDPEKGYDLILTLSLQKAPNGKEYTTITSIIPDDKSVLHENAEIAQEWINDPLIWSDVYSIKSEEYLEIVAIGGTPKWDSENNKWISNVDVDTTEQPSTKPTVQTQAPATAPVFVAPDPQDGDDTDDDLPF